MLSGGSFLVAERLSLIAGAPLMEPRLQAHRLQWWA